MSVGSAEGLEGVIAADSSICTVDGLVGQLTYAGLFDQGPRRALILRRDDVLALAWRASYQE